MLGLLINSLDFTSGGLEVAWADVGSVVVVIDLLVVCLLMMLLVMDSMLINHCGMSGIFLVLSSSSSQL